MLNNQTRSGLVCHANRVLRSTPSYIRHSLAIIFGYDYVFRRSKLELVRIGELDDGRRGDTRFGPLANFLETVPLIYPHELFQRDNDPKARACGRMRAHPAFADASRIIVNRKEKAATHLADRVMPAVGNNKLRHETLQKCMQTKDSVTVAIEIPIWLAERDIAALEEQNGKCLERVSVPVGRNLSKRSKPCAPSWGITAVIALAIPARPRQGR